LDVTTIGKQLLPCKHIRYIKTNNPVSAYDTHILNNRHEYRTAKDTLKLIQSSRKFMKINHSENMYLHIYRQQDQLFTEQEFNELHPLYELAQLPHTLRNSSQSDHQQTRTPNTHMYVWSSSDQISHFSYPGYHEHHGNYSKELLYYR